MKKIIVDTNIIFSCLLNSRGIVGDIIFNSGHAFEFYSNQYMRFEIRKHWNKLLKASKMNDSELRTAYEKLTTRLTFITTISITTLIQFHLPFKSPEYKTRVHAYQRRSD